ncbi:hypothetical protein N7462_008653 [Penicillium macrosclerotiorum]|uniref:uncharacterized protein n=1 Tax=Penicillium macrosclerotiorum TaxID=303699 RepID=UPI0025468596|nr:uncharacterized protein N7462_008653 [Penicillium macrosclerotiorum]KAJ5675756.1 hypothetical protein N7462_008653 [Penicillium macrosclerotiorum]
MHENLYPPRRQDYGNDYDRYLKDYDIYQKFHAKSLERRKKKHKPRSYAGVYAAAATAGGGGGGC